MKFDDLTPGQQQALQALQQALRNADTTIDSDGRRALDRLRVLPNMSGALAYLNETLDEMFPPPLTYEVVCFYRDNRDPANIYSGLTKDEAKEHCTGPDTSGDGWFYGWREE